MSRAVIRVPRSCVVQTPAALAHAMIKALGKVDGERWLEPCVGNGALLGALASLGVKKGSIVGLDIDASPRPNDQFGRIFRGTEFLGWSQSTRHRFDKIVANPPYIALERLHPSIQRAALATSFSEQIAVSANGNAWFAFLCAAIGLLKQNGSLCFLLPAAWEFANYAAPLRKSISQYFSSTEIYRTTSPIFRAEGVQDGSIVLLAKGKQGVEERNSRNRLGTVRRTEVASIEDLVRTLSSVSRNLETSEVSRNVAAPAIRRSVVRQRLGNSLKIRLGLVTGDSSYFLFSESRRRELCLPRYCLTPVLSRARHLVASRLTIKRWDRLRDADERVWLFNPGPKAMQNPHVKAYLRYGRNGGCQLDNHKVALRSPWYRFPTFTNGDAFMSGMSSSMPWLCFREMPKLAITNTLYLASFIDREAGEKRKIGIAMSLLTSEARELLHEKGRTYAAGLLKHEPSDLLGLELPCIDEHVVSWDAYQRAIRAMSMGRIKEARTIADGCLVRF